MATRFTRATGDCLRPDFFRVLLRPPDFRALFVRLADLLRPRFLEAPPRRVLRADDFRVDDFRADDFRADDFRADDFRALAPRFRDELRDFLAPDDRFFEAFRPDFLLDDLLRVAIVSS